MESMVSSTKIIQVFFEVNMETNFDNDFTWIHGKPSEAKAN